MDDIDNEARADRAAAALETYAAIGYFHSSGEPTEDALVDLLCDLRHLADRYSVDFDQLVVRSLTHHVAEVHGDGFDAGGPPAQPRPDRGWPTSDGHVVIPAADARRLANAFAFTMGEFDKGLFGTREEAQALKEDKELLARLLARLGERV
jgi:hypothetical protein